MSDNIHPRLFDTPISQPLPALLAESLRQAIYSGKLTPGQQLPSEPEFAAQLGVSRTTLREAVQILVNECIIQRRRGIGTFVAKNALINIQEGLETLIGTTALIRKQGYEPGTADSSWEVLPAPPKLAQILEVPEDTPLLHFTRTRTANGIPVIYSEEYLPSTVLEPQAIPAASQDWSLYRLLTQANATVVSAVSKIIPITADKRMAKHLNVANCHPLLLLCQIHYDENHRPILYCENYHNSDMIEFHIIRR